MKHSLLTAILFISFESGFSQSDLVVFHFKEVGMSIMVPSKFEIVKSTEDEKLRSKGEELLENANNVQVDASKTKNLLSVRQGQFNYLNITATPYKQTRQNGWEKDTKEVKNMIHKSFADKVTSKNVDTISTQIDVDGILFDKFEMTIRINTTMTMKMILLSKLWKGYDFGIAYTFLDRVIGKQLDDIVLGAKFEK